MNVQDVQEFTCQQLNRDVWSNEAVRTIIRESFVLWQVRTTKIIKENFVLWQVRTTKIIKENFVLWQVRLRELQYDALYNSGKYILCCSLNGELATVKDSKTNVSSVSPFTVFYGG